MSIRINNLHIRNFKSFEDIFIDFSNADLVVLDGPNGFGKTTVYDAIELLINGKINRYERLYKETVDGRYTYSEHPYLCENSTDGDLEIISEMSIKDTTIKLRRVMDRNDLESNFSIPETISYLFVSDIGEGIEDKKIDDEERFFKDLLGENYASNFEFINYIEQEENLSFLKQKDSDRRNKIGYLFNTIDFDNKENKLKAISSKLSKLTSRAKSEELKAQKLEIEKIEQSINVELDNTEYFQLITGKEIIWDKEVIPFESYSYENLLGKESDLGKFKNLITEKEIFKKVIKNREIQKIVLKDNELKDFLQFAMHVELYDKYKELASLKNSIKDFIKGSKEETADFIDLKCAKLDDAQIKLINANSFVEEYHAQLESIKVRLKSNEKLNNSLNELKRTREELVKRSDEIKDFPESPSVCIFCGHDWKEESDMMKNIGEQTKLVSDFIENNATVIEKDLIGFREKYIDLIKSRFELYMEELEFDDSQWKLLNKYYLDDGKVKVEKWKIKLNNLGVQFEDLLSTKLEGLMNDSNLSLLISRIRKYEEEVDGFSISESNSEIFEKILDADISLLDTVSTLDVDKKIKYIKNQYNIFCNDLLKAKKEKYDLDNSKYNKAKKIQSEINKIKGKYNDCITQYQKSIIKDIEILFHIYSGRIVQDRNGGNGLFITTTNGIKFVDHPKNSFDALFKLSSGQLAALVISFTLALNKKYALDKLLLIDDPVQTLDELNISAFIEVLRNDFSDRQIFISTHEDIMSAFMRYKFEMYGLNTERISMSEVQLSTVSIE